MNDQIVSFRNLRMETLFESYCLFESAGASEAMECENFSHKAFSLNLVISISDVVHTSEEE